MSDVPRPKAVLCSLCRATASDGAARTLTVGEGALLVTWHAAGCPHYAADRILAGHER